jgi:hypothetical protein
VRQPARSPGGHTRHTSPSSSDKTKNGCASGRSRWRPARPQAAEALRARAFRAAYDDWIAATEIRAFCDALESARPGTSGHNDRQAWIAWGRAAADRIDPAGTDGPLAGTSFDVVPGPDDLRPFLDGWSPHQPRREYRSGQDQQHTAALHRDTTIWYPGMRGRPSWWRHQ